MGEDDRVVGQYQLAEAHLVAMLYLGFSAGPRADPHQAVGGHKIAGEGQ